MLELSKDFKVSHTHTSPFFSSIWRKGRLAYFKTLPTLTLSYGTEMIIKPVHYYKVRIDGAHRLTPTIKSKFVSSAHFL